MSAEGLARTSGPTTTTAGAETTTLVTPTTPSISTAPAPSTSQPEKRRSASKGNTRPLRSFKSYDPLLDSWYFHEVNTRLNKDVDLFRNYQINPYTKKTLDYVTPKITERRRPLPNMEEVKCGCGQCRNSEKEESAEDAKLKESYKIVKDAIYRSVNVPKLKFCEPQTELMRLGWFPEYQPPPTNNACLYIKTCWSDKPCCYFYPRSSPDGSPQQQQNENYDERFRAVHQTAEFIKTETQLRAFDAVMNPNGYRGKRKTMRVLPGSISMPSSGKRVSSLANPTSTTTNQAADIRSSIPEKRASNASANKPL